MNRKKKHHLTSNTRSYLRKNGQSLEKRLVQLLSPSDGGLTHGGELYESRRGSHASLNRGGSKPLLSEIRA